jgi:hypothetical protein
MLGPMENDQSPNGKEPQRSEDENPREDLAEHEREWAKFSNWVDKLLADSSPKLDAELLAAILKLVTDGSVHSYFGRFEDILAYFGDVPLGLKFIDRWVPVMTVNPTKKTPEQMKMERRRNEFAYGFLVAELYYRPELREKVQQLVGVPW